MNIPKSIPKKFHPFIESIHTEAGLSCCEEPPKAFGYVVATQGISTMDYAGEDSAHSIFARTISDVIDELKRFKTCDCKTCKQYRKKHQIQSLKN